MGKKSRWGDDAADARESGLLLELCPVSHSWEEALQLAQRAAREAGDWLSGLNRREPTILSQEGRDIKLAADQEAESRIVACLRAESPYPILAEEGGESGPTVDGEPRWVVDPLDGTLNFSRELPLCCTSIALMAGTEPILGVVYDFNRGEFFSGLASGGAWCNGTPMRVSDVAIPERAVLATGLPACRTYTVDALLPMVERFRRFRKVRMLGSAALMLAYLAAGRVDAYEEEDIMLWDIAAGLALVRGAGGHITVQPSVRHRWGCHARCASRASVWDVFSSDTDAKPTPG